MAGALLFDLDGTLIASDPLHVEVFIAFFAERGIAIDAADYAAQMHGRMNEAIFASYFPGQDATALAAAKEAAFRARLGASVPATPGILALLDRADAAGLPCAVVTNAPPDNAAAMLAAIGLADRFRTVVCAADVARGKPHPEPYRLALHRLGAAANESLAFEDSPTGIASALAAGLTTIGLRSSHGDAALRTAGAVATIEDFTDPALGPLLARLAGAEA